MQRIDIWLPITRMAAAIVLIATGCLAPTIADSQIVDGPFGRGAADPPVNFEGMGGNSLNPLIGNFGIGPSTNGSNREQAVEQSLTQLEANCTRAAGSDVAAGLQCQRTKDLLNLPQMEKMRRLGQ
jgi:hypothetical protein